MTARSALEEALEYLINEDHDKAVEAFHEFVVQKARAIHETLIEDDDLDDEIDEAVDKDEVDEAKKDEVDEAKKDEVDEAKKDEVDEKEDKEVDESIADMRHNIRSDEYFGREELTTEDDDDNYDNGNGNEMDFGDDEAEMDLGDNGDMEGEEVVIAPEEAADLAGALAALQTKFDEIVGPVEVEDEMDMDMDMDMEVGDEVGGEEFPEEPADESFGNELGGRFMGEGKDEEEVDESEDKDDVDEAVSHGQGVMDTKSGIDRFGKGGSGDSLLSNSDAKLPEAAEFDFDLTEEDFLDLEEGLKAVNVQMGGEQGGVKFAGEETNTKSPVADKDSSKLLGTGSKDMISKQTEHGTYDRETAPTNESLPHSGDNSHDKADQTGSPSRSQVSKGGGLDKQKGYGEGEVGAGKFAGTETNVKSPIGSQGTRNDS